jgi:predicted amidohydrolase
MKVAALQHDIEWERPRQNHAHLAPRIAEPADGPSTTFLVDQAAAHQVWLCGSVPTRHGADGLPTNRLVLAGPAGELHHYDKVHPFSYAGEHEHYAAGDRVITVDVEGVRVTPFVCYDLRFGDEFWAAAADTDLYVVVANWPAARRAHWRVLLPARAIENQAYVLGVNRVGSGDGVDYVGDSMVVDPFGELLARADSPEEQLVIADVDPARVQDVRDRYPFLRDRRT